MSNFPRAVALMVLTQVSACCGGAWAQSDPPYQAGVGSAIYAGSPAPESDTKANVSMYFGHYVVRAGGSARGCCYSTGMVSGNSGKPQGAVLVLWTAAEYGDEQVFSDALQTWITKPVSSSYYYAVSQQSRLAPYPPKANGHRFYGIYVSAGRVVVSRAGLRPENATVATEFTARTGKAMHVFGCNDTLYYKIISQGSDSPSVADDRSSWNEIPGVALTEAQYFELSKCSPGLECRWFLSPADPDLTTEQREYLQQNPLEPADMKVLLKRIERSRRQKSMWN